MRKSKYTFVFKKNEDTYLLYNTFKNSLLKTNEFGVYLLNNFSNKEFQKKYNSFYCELVKHGILVKNSEDENIVLLLNKRNFSRYSQSKFFHLTILPTEKCNFSCNYCYQSSKKHDMNIETADEIIRFINGYGPDSLKITWFGGEPLLRIDIMEHICKGLKDINFKSEIITNGSLLNRNNISRLCKINLESIQITIDGNKETHNNSRKFSNGKPSYELIIKNVHNVLKYTDNIPVSIRTNIRPETKSHFDEVRNDLFLIFNSSKVSFYHGFIIDSDIKGPSCNSCMNLEQYYDFIINNQSCEFPSHDYGLCMANTFNSITVDPIGKIYKCWLDLGDVNKSVGSIFGHIFSSKHIGYIHQKNPFKDSVCLSCKMFPICTGGCHRSRLKINSNQHDLLCRFTPELLEKVIVYQYNQFAKNNNISSALT